jgi:hypothetical protein
MRFRFAEPRSSCPGSNLGTFNLGTCLETRRVDDDMDLTAVVAQTWATWLEAERFRLGPPSMVQLRDMHHEAPRIISEPPLLHMACIALMT